MPDIYELADDLGLPGVDDTSAVDGEEADGDDDGLESATIEDRVADLFSHKETSKEQPSDKDSDDTQVAKGGKGDSVDGTGEQNQKPEQKPSAPDSFEEASKNVFLNDDGGLDSEKVADYFVDSNKHAIDFSSIQDTSLESTKKNGEEEAETPDSQYHKSISDIVESLPDIMKEEAGKGFSPEETMQRLMNTFSGFHTEREARKGLQSEREQLSTEFKGELEQVKQDKLTARIQANATELSEHYKDIIPGMKGTDVLDKFLLDKKYGGKMIDSWFRRDSNGFDALSDEDKKETTGKWFQNFQANKRDMATVAEYGRAMWLAEQIPGIVQHAQKVGASKSKNEADVVRGKPSPITNEPGQKGSSGLDGFFGYDTVN